jgi:hypothetical protein
VSGHDERQRPEMPRIKPPVPPEAPRIKRSAAEEKKSERARAFEAVEATFPSAATATSDELVQMAIHALGFDGAALAASLGIARSTGETLMRNPGTLSARQRALLAQYLEMREDAGTNQRNRAIAAKLRERLAADARADAKDGPRPSP